jgi:hypothetical protein
LSAFCLKKWNGEYNKPNPAGNNYFARFLDENRERRERWGRTAGASVLQRSRFNPFGKHREGGLVAP